MARVRMSYKIMKGPKGRAIQESFSRILSKDQMTFIRGPKPVEAQKKDKPPKFRRRGRIINNNREDKGAYD